MWTASKREKFADQSYPIFDLKRFSSFQVPLAAVAKAVEGSELDLEVSCIEEEKLEVGIGDEVEVVLPSDSLGSGQSSFPKIVVKQVREWNTLNACR